MKRTALFILGLMIFVYACGPSVEGEQKAWKKSQEIVNKLKTDYPAYVQLIDYKFEQAQKSWEAAKSIKDEDQKAEKMAEANNYIRRGALGTLSSLKSDIASLRSKKDNLMKKVAPAESFNNRINIALQEANSAIDQSEKALYITGNLSVQDAESSLNSAGSKLSSASKSVRGVVSAIDKYVRDQKKQNQTTTTNSTTTNSSSNTTGTTTTTQTKPKQIKCQYCGTMNDADATKCKNCGAPLK